jgi:hypothetical protein
MQYHLTICGMLSFVEAEAEDGIDLGMQPIKEVSRWSVR